jgi:uncharacterized protein (DUF1684 family)
MKKIILIFVTLFACHFSFAQAYKDSIQSFIDDYVKTHEVVTGDNKQYLKFYTPDENYRVLAQFQKSTGPKWLQITTSGKQKQNFRVYGVITFKLQDTIVKLNVYQSQDLMQDPNYKDYLLLMFTDETTGKESYEGGRYLDFTTSDIHNNSLLIDFNKAYNPYCAYESGKYNCPIPPIENHLPVAVRAGEKIYDKAH